MTVTDPGTPAVRLRARLTRLDRYPEKEASRFELATELTAGLPVLASVECRDGCSLGLLVRDACGFWSIIVEHKDTPVAYLGMSQAQIIEDLGFHRGPYPTVYDAFTALFTHRLPDQWRDEWVEGLLAVAYLDSVHETVAETEMMLALARPDLAASLLKQRTVRANLPYWEDLTDAFGRALAVRGLDDVPVENLLRTMDHPSFIGEMWLADRADWSDMAHQFIEVWDANRQSTD